MVDLDGDGLNDFVSAERRTAPALVWYRRTASGWERRVIEAGPLRIEAGAAAQDITGNGYPDVVFGGDAGSNRGYGMHEARPSDLDGDGRLDILARPCAWQTPRLDLWINEGVRFPAGSRRK